MTDDEDLVFISYAREDRAWAERLYMDLRKHEVNAWLDVRSLKAGASWKGETRRAIRRSRWFILLVSRHSVNKRGFVQREIKEALDMLKDFPTGAVFLIPARLDPTDAVDDELHELNWVDLFPDYYEGLARILSVIERARPAPLVVATLASSPAVPLPVIDKGREITISVPLVVGERAAIRYAPFRTAREFLQQFMDRLPTESMYADRSFSYYLTLDTRDPDLLIGDDLKARFPEYITLVMQNAFRELQVRERGVSVILQFGGVERTVAIPYDAIRQIQIPQIGISIRVEPPAPA